MIASAVVFFMFHDARTKPKYSILRDSMSLPKNSHSKIIPLPKIDSLPIWSTKTAINRIACNQEYKESSNGWVIKQWKNEKSLCSDIGTKTADYCDNADSVFHTPTSSYCHWKEQQQVLLSIDSKEMPNQGCNPNARGNVGGYVAYLAWEPKILSDYYKNYERYMLSNMEEIFVRFRFKNKKVGDKYKCRKTRIHKDITDTHAVVHSYATATFSELDPKTNKGTGRTIFYQILNYDARKDIQGETLNGYHFYLKCNYKNGKQLTMIYRDTVTDFDQKMAFPQSDIGGGEFVDYEFNLMAGMKYGLTRCYDDANPDNFKFAGFHIGTEIKNGANHTFVIQKPEIEIIYKNPIQ